MSFAIYVPMWPAIVLWSMNQERSSPLLLVRSTMPCARDIARLKGPYRMIAEQVDAGKYDAALIHPDQYTYAPWVLSYLRTPTVYYCHDPLRPIYDPPI